MNLWNEWYSHVHRFQWACRRNRTFVFLVLVLIGFTIRMDSAGVSSFIRASSLDPVVYKGMLHFFNYSTGLMLDVLTELWIGMAHRLFSPLQVGEYWVYVADGLKVAKEGKKMPGVKKLHQASENSTKAEYIMGHSFQAIALLACLASGQVTAVPLVARIHEGVIWFPGDRRSLLDKLASLFGKTVASVERKVLLVADAYYASRKVIIPLMEQGHQLLTRVRSNAVAYHPAVPKKGGKGRPKKYGKRVQLRNCFKQRERFTRIASPVYGETNVKIAYQYKDLLWRPIGRLVRFVWVIHPTRGRLILMCTDVSLAPVTIIQTYGYRFKIEVSFRQAIHVVGSYTYHFWMKNMKPIRWNSGNQYLHKKTETYRNQVRRKMEAYHRFVQLGCIAQGLLQYLALQHGQTVWANFHSWLRTMKTDRPPSELVVSHALRSSLWEFLVNSPDEQNPKKIITENMKVQNIEEFRLAA